MDTNIRQRKVESIRKASVMELTAAYGYDAVPHGSNEYYRIGKHFIEL